MKRYVTALLMFLVLSFIPLKASAVDLFSSACSGKNTAASAVCNDTTTGNPVVGPNGVIVKVTQIIAVVAGAAAVILIIISGIKFITSTGDSNSVQSARETIIYALIGLVVIVLAQSIIVFVVKKL